MGASARLGEPHPDRMLVCQIALVGALTSRHARLGRPLSASRHAPLRAAAASPPSLLLTSGGLTTRALEEAFHRMLPETETERRIAMLATAQMAPSGEPSARSAGDRRRRRWADAKKRGRELSAQLGMPVDVVDCGTAEKAAEAERVLGAAETACVWVAGGNSFFLWHHMRASGVGELVRRRVVEDGLLYVGCSAGSIVAGQDVSTAYWKGWDDPRAGGALDGVDWAAPGATTALGLVAGVSFFPHHTDEFETLVAARRGALGHEVVCLRDAGRPYVVGGPA